MTGRQPDQDAAPGLLERLFPGLALRRMQKLARLELAKRTYNAAKDSRLRKRPTLSESPDAAMHAAGDRLRAWARYLDENHDLAIGVLDSLVNNIIGTGLTVQPMVASRTGRPSDRLNRDLLELYQEWARRPEVTGELSFDEVQRLACRAWLRDGEILAQHVEGSGKIRHLGPIPYSLELIEADFLPFEHYKLGDGIIHGVQKDAWGRPVAYHLYKEHPGNMAAGLMMPSARELKVVSADNLIHLKFTRRPRQTRGVTVFHGVITRLDDIRDYEESERIAARVAASFTAFIKKNPDLAATTNTDGDRTFEMDAGMVFDNLLPGEEIGVIDSKRPNSALGDFRSAMMRAVASGTGSSYSSISRDYNGTYSAQRQELVESIPAYNRMRKYFVTAFLQPVYRRFVDMAILSGAISVPRTVGDRVYMADFGGVAMPWIDPLKEVNADKMAVEARFKSRHQVIRERGYDPRIVDEQIAADTAAPPAAEPAPAAAPEDSEDQDGQAGQAAA